MPCRPHPFGPPNWGVHLSRPTKQQRTRFNLPPIPYEVGLEWQRVAGESFQHPALLHQLFEQYNTISIPLLSPEHFYDDALALARQAPTRADLEQSFANKFLERRKELEKALDDVARDVVAKPSLFPTATSQKMARKMTTTCSLQDILGFFCAVSYHLDEDKEKEAIAKRQKEEEETIRQQRERAEMEERQRTMTPEQRRVDTVKRRMQAKYGFILNAKRVSLVTDYWERYPGDPNDKTYDSCDDSSHRIMECPDKDLADGPGPDHTQQSPHESQKKHIMPPLSIRQEEVTAAATTPRPKRRSPCDNATSPQDGPLTKRARLVASSAAEGSQCCVSEASL